MAFDPARILRASKLRIGSFRVQGAPAILLGIAAVIMATGAARSLSVLAPLLPETLRESKALLDASRREPKPLKA